MNLDELTLGDIKKLQNLIGSKTEISNENHPMIGKYVIIRTYSAGVWAGYLHTKVQGEVIIKEARRLYRFWCKKSISLSAVSLYGIIEEKSRLAAPVDEVCLQWIEIIPTTEGSKKSIVECVETKQD